MCGIVGILGREPVAGLLVDALKRLEYRGYDSAGVATRESGQLVRRRAEGKLRNLEARLAREPLAGTTGIGHTRWATHGRPTESNAHPHATERLAVVHNGIIENFRELREALERTGAKFGADTDTEVDAHLVTREMKNGRPPAEAVAGSVARARGAGGSLSAARSAFGTCERVTMPAGGTAYYAGLVAKSWFERFARLPIEIDVASEFRYREFPRSAGGLSFFVSQSGETADTL